MTSNVSLYFIIHIIVLCEISSGLQLKWIKLYKWGSFGQLWIGRGDLYILNLLYPKIRFDQFIDSRPEYQGRADHQQHTILSLA